MLCFFVLEVEDFAPDRLRQLGQTAVIGTGVDVNWEAGRSRPRQGMIEKILATRRLGRRDVKRLLGKKKKR